LPDLQDPVGVFLRVVQVPPPGGLLLDHSHDQGVNRWFGSQDRTTQKENNQTEATHP
jgi:hypothetical protein